MSRLPAALAAVIVLLAAAGFFATPYDPLAQNREAVSQGPNAAHWMGTDDYGRDVFSRFLAGGSWSLVTGAAATALALGLAWTLGCLAGFRGGWWDWGIMALADVFLSVPWLYLLIGIRAALPLDVRPRVVVALTLAVIAAISWARPARLIRGVVLSAANRGSVEAARGFGAGEWHIFTRHILGDTAAVVAAQALILFPRFVLAEVTLSFLGLGAGEQDPSWGGLLLGLKQTYLLGREWWRVLPAVLMLPVFAACAWGAQLAVRRSGVTR
ncbi:MAG: ABC transporter permease [Bryobacteraceae bacterium]